MRESFNTNSAPCIRPELRLMQPEDALSLMRLRHRAIAECACHFGTPVSVELARRMPYYLRQLQRYREQGRAALIGCWCGGELAGMSGVRIRRYRGEDLGLIYSTFIEAPFRGRGLGKLLVERSRQEIRERWQLRHFLMHVEVHNQTALRLYQHCGFAITGQQERAFWIEGRPHDVYVLELKEQEKHDEY